MNNKGLFGILGGLLGFFILMLVIVSLIPYHFQPEVDFNNTLDWNSLNASQKFIQGSDNNTVVDVAYKFIDFFGYASFEIANAAVEFGKERPDIVNPVVLLYLVILALLSPILFSLFKMIIVVFILIREYFQSKKEKKMMEDIKK